MTSRSDDYGFNPSLPDPLADLREYGDQHPVISSLEVTFESLEDGVLRATIPYQEEFANPGTDGTYHGGIVVTILDTVMGFALAGSLADDESKDAGPTETLTSHFHAPSTEDFEAFGTVVEVGSTSAFLRGRLFGQESGTLIASAEGHWHVFRR